MEKLKQKVIDRLSQLVDDNTITPQNKIEFDRLSGLLNIIINEPEYKQKERYFEKQQAEIAKIKENKEKNG